jgi:hypothetical protein
MLIIPVPTEAAESFTQRTRIEGIDYSLRFSHNSRADRWSLDIAAIGGVDQADVPIVTGAMIFIGNDLLRYASHELAPPGVLLALSADGSRRAPGLDALGTRVQLYYVEAGEKL